MINRISNNERIEMSSRVNPSHQPHPSDCCWESSSEDVISPQFPADETHKDFVTECKNTTTVHSFSDHLCGDEILFIGKEIKCRVCNTYMEKRSGSESDGCHCMTCMCGFPLSEHFNPELAERNGRRTKVADWDYKRHTSTRPTNAFGEIQFVGFGDKVAKYVRVDSETSMHTMRELMVNKWGMVPPNLLISVTGGAKNFAMRPKLKDAFRRGLMKAALSTGAWIVTGGTNAGVMKHVGEAVRDYGLTAEGRVVAIGVAPWGCIQNKEVLMCQPPVIGKWPALYRLPAEQRSKQSSLDPNHSHFILADNGTQLQFATEIEFRAKLENEISQWKTNTGSDAVRVPVALLVVEGGPGSLKTVVNAIKNNTPAVVIKGTGKCADILAFAAQRVTETEFEVKDSEGNVTKETVYQIGEQLRCELTKMVEETLVKKNVAECVKMVEDCVLQPHLLSVYELESDCGGDSAGGVDVALLRALLKANKDQVVDQLKLALAWNRIDVAKSEIFSLDRSWPVGALEHMMMSAIQLNRVDFVDLFLDNGVSLKDFLSVRRLLKLYNEIPKHCQLYFLLSKIKSNQQSKTFSLVDVGSLIQHLMGDFFQPDYLTNSSQLKVDVNSILDDDAGDTGNTPSFTPHGGEDYEEMLMPRPAQDLLIWAVLMNQHDLAKLFWREGNESTAAALVANSLLKAMVMYTSDSDVKQRLQRNAEEFEDLAVGVMNVCYLQDEQRAQELLVREMDNWGGVTCIMIAVQADNKRFVSHMACQTLLNNVWMGKMSQDNGLLKLLFSIILFPLIFVAIKFKENERKTASDSFVWIKGLSKASRDPVMKKISQLNLEVEGDDIASEKCIQTQRKMSTTKRIVAFYTAPVIIFTLNCLSYLIFLLLYSYILLIQLSNDFHWSEAVLIVWVLTIFVEEIRQLSDNSAISVQAKVLTYLDDFWNVLDMITIVLFTVGMSLRFIPNSATFSVARVVLSINLISFFFRILHIFSVKKELGPKLVMIRRMIGDLLWFVVILMVFIMSYAIASEAILYPQTEPSWKLLYHLPRKAYWQIYGELFLDDLEGASVCTNDPDLYRDYGQQRCPSDIGRYLVPVLMGVYVLMTNVLLLNLLIAMFSYTFQMVQENTDIHWYFQRFTLIHEYYKRPWMPPPFTLFLHVYMVVRWCLTGCHSKPTSTDFRKRFHNQQEEKRLVQWENIIADTYLTKLVASEAQSLEGRVKSIVLKVDSLQNKFEDFSENWLHSASNMSLTVPSGNFPTTTTTSPVRQVIQLPPLLEQHIGYLTDQVKRMTQALDWIGRSMEEHDLSCATPRPVLTTYGSGSVSADALDKVVEWKPDHDSIKARWTSHMSARCPVYPNSVLGRCPVPDDRVSWEVPFEEYDPVRHTDDLILNGASFSDPFDLLALPLNSRLSVATFNKFDQKNNVSRISFEGPYTTNDGVPLNPHGRTGLEGRGLLGRWGPNMAVDFLVTRWKRETTGHYAMAGARKVLQFVGVKRKDNRMWTLPGAFLRPGEAVGESFRSHFAREALGSLMGDPAQRAVIDEKLTALSSVTLFQGYFDDARNSDNAWIETSVLSFHDDSGEIFHNFDLRAGPNILFVSWITVSSKLLLYASHMHFLRLAAGKYQAAF